MTSKDNCPLIYAAVVDGAGNSQRILDQTHRILSLTYTDSEAKADKCVLTVDNNDLSNFDDMVWAHRNILRVSWGYAGNMSLQRELIITKVTGFRVLNIEARALSVVMDAKKKSRTFTAMTRSEVVERIAAEYGYTGERAFIQKTGTRYEHITQPHMSDAMMLRKLAKQQGYEFWVDGTGLHWHERQMAQPPVRKFTWFTDAARSEVLDIFIEKDITRRPVEVKVVARDPDTRTTTDATASDEADPDRQGTGAILLVAAPDLKTGALQYEYIPDDVGGMCVDNSPPSVVAKRKFRQSQRGAVKIRLDVRGDPSLLAKTVFTLGGVGQHLNGNYYAKEITHKVSSGSYTMNIEAVSDGGGPLTAKRALPGENGLPEVTPQASKAKRTNAQAPDQKIGGHDPGELEAVPLLDESGNEIGASFHVRGTGATAIVNGALVNVEE